MLEESSSTTSLSLDENDLRDILDGMVDGVITINCKGKILSFNKSAETIFGYQAEEIIGQNVSMLMPESDSSHHDDYLDNFMATGDAQVIGIGRNVTALRKNGEQFPMRLSVIEYPAKIDGERWFIGSCLDITLQQQQEDQLRRSLKMEALGKLTGGISHDYNNMLGVILGYSDLLADHFKDDPEHLDYVDQIRRAAQRGSDLTRRLLSFSRNRPTKTTMVNINDVLNEDRKMLAKTLTARIELSMKLDDDLWPVLVDKSCLEDAILNMSINAMHAMPEGGTLEFKTSNVSLGALDAQVLNIAQGDFVKLSITDTGIGMSKEIVSHIFEPFFTTKEEKGTGLGLSQTYNFVAKSNGTIRVYSEPAQGTCFSLYIPRYDAELFYADIGDQMQRLDNSQYRGSETILIVDDEVSIRKLNTEILGAQGYNVLCAEEGEQALSILEDTVVDLVISDVIMPKMDGYELAHLIRYICPKTKVQLCSGFDEVKGKTVTDETLQKSILQKPYTAVDLLQRVKELLDSK